MAATIEVRNLSHTYSVGTPFQHDAVKHMNFTVERGEFLGIIGHTGSGKSTLIQHLNGLLKPTEGDVLLDGESIVGAYKTVRDQVIFTTHRIIMVDMQGVTGTRQQIFVLPYRKVLHFGIQTAGFGDPVQASQLTVCFADAHEAKFGFIGQQELFAVANAISRCIL